MKAAAALDVIIPVYRGFDETRRCIESVLSSRCHTRFELVVVDDASPEPDLSAWLDELAAQGRLSLLRNERNLGFVGSVNRGMALHPERDVVLLNSDTAVANDWLDRIVRCADSDPRIATVTPFSSNATICTYPFEGWNGGVPGQLGLAALDDLFARTLCERIEDLPTAVGFCMFIRRESLNALGLFDAETFGRGYGEENDFCMRALKAGWRNVLAADVFVHHESGTSFGPERFELMQAAGRALLAKHPDYDERVRSFIVADPLRPLREVVDAARAAHSPAEAACVREEQNMRPAAPPQAEPESVAPPVRDRRPVCLHISHSWGGGIERWIRDLARADEDFLHLVLRSRSERNEAGFSLDVIDPLREGAEAVLLEWPLTPPIGSTAVAHAGYRQIFRDLVQGLGVERLMVSSLIGHSLEVLESGLPTVLVLHDFYPFCPALFAWFGEECSDCGSGRLRDCFQRNPQNVFWHHAEVDYWMRLRTAYGELLADERLQVVAPSRSVQARYATLFPALAARPWALIPHGLGSLGPALPLGRFAAEAAAGRRLKVLLPGRLLPHKGLPLFAEMLPELLAFADVYLLGCGVFGKPFEGMVGVTVLPDYAHEELGEQVRAYAPDVALLLSTLPETFSYTLSEMRALGVPVVATRLGAFAERIEHGANGFLAEPDAASVLAVLRELDGQRARLDEVARRQAEQPALSLAEMAQRYDELFPPRAEAEAASLAADFCARNTLWAQKAKQLEQEAGAGRERVQALEQQLTLAQSQLEALTQQCAEQDAERLRLLASTSWRLTRPLRALKSLLLRASAKRPEPESVKPEQVLESGALVHEAAGRPPCRVPASEAERRRIREALRFGLGLPDQTRMVAAAAPDTAPEEGLEAFAQLAAEVCAQRTDVRFVWFATAVRPEFWPQAAHVTAASRQLFVAPPYLVPEWLAGADLWLGGWSEDFTDEMALEAVRAGVPVCAVHDHSLPAALRPADLVAHAGSDLPGCIAACLPPVSESVD